MTTTAMTGEHPHGVMQTPLILSPSVLLMTSTATPSIINGHHPQHRRYQVRTPLPNDHDSPSIFGDDDNNGKHHHQCPSTPSTEDGMVNTLSTHIVVDDSYDPSCTPP